MVFRNGLGILPSCPPSDESWRLYVKIAIKVNEFAILNLCQMIFQNKTTYH